MLEKSHSPSVQPHLKKKFPIVSMSIAAILSLTACEQNPTTWCPPQWVPVSASIGLDGAPWRDVECQQSGAILWEFMNEPRKL